MKNKNLTPYILVLPSLLVFLIFWILPLVSMGALSFTQWNMVSPEIPFVGLDNYQQILRSSAFWQVVKNTLYYTFFFVFFVTAISLPLALWLNKNTKTHKLAQASIFSPHIISLVSVSLIFMSLMEPQGIFNSILQGLGMEPIGWLQDPKYALNSLILVSVWKSLGYYTLIFIAALGSIPGELYEAADLDNASGWRKFTKITIPNIAPTLFFVILINIINGIQVFETINIMTAGGPANSTKTVVYYIYEQGFQFFNLGHASAAGMILLVILMIITFFYFRLLGNKMTLGGR